jgi:RHS repeat-associated protein
VAPDNPNRFAGELLDTGTGLYGLRARMYDPAVGRFLSLDPRPAGQTNPFKGSYVYAINNPAGWIDPSGLGAVLLMVGPVAVASSTGHANSSRSSRPGSAQIQS